MMTNRSKIHRLLCITLSACLFVQQGNTAPSLEQKNINSAKDFLNKTGMGRSQTLGQWFDLAKEYLDEEVVAVLEIWVAQNSTVPMPPVEVKLVNTKTTGKYLSLKFKVGTRDLTFELRQDKNGPLLKRDGVSFTLDELMTSDSMQKVMSTHAQILPYNVFRQKAEIDPEWGVKYLRGLRDLIVTMEESHKVFLKTNKKTSQLFIEEFIPRAYAEAPEFDLGTECPVAGWGGTWNAESGHCLKSAEGPMKDGLADYTCENPSEIDCNPLVFGYKTDGGRFCVPKVPKEQVSAQYCDKLNPITRPEDLAAMLKKNDEILGIDGNNQASKWGLFKLVEMYKGMCLSSSQMKDDTYLPFAKMRNVGTEAFDQKFPGSGTKDNPDKNFHNREACRAFFNRIAFLDELNQPNQPPAITPPKAEACPKGTPPEKCPQKTSPPVVAPPEKGAPNKQIPIEKKFCRDADGSVSDGCIVGGIAASIGLAALLVALLRKPKKKTTVINKTKVKNIHHHHWLPVRPPVPPPTPQPTPPPVIPEETVNPRAQNQ
jgi:hypothetical protein